MKRLFVVKIPDILPASLRTNRIFESNCWMFSAMWRSVSLPSITGAIVMYFCQLSSEQNIIFLSSITPMNSCSPICDMTGYLECLYLRIIFKTSSLPIEDCTQIVFSIGIIILVTWSSCKSGISCRANS